MIHETCSQWHDQRTSEATLTFIDIVDQYQTTIKTKCQMRVYFQGELYIRLEVIPVIYVYPNP